MILTKTSTKTDKSSFSQKRLISLSPHLIFRTTPFYFVTYSPFCNLIGLQYALQREQLVRPDPLRASKRVWLHETSEILTEAFQKRAFSKVINIVTPAGFRPVQRKP